jgi:glycerophosphoryl diester phosphodiesterase
MHPLLDPTRRPVFAHRGNSAHAPENTVQAFQEAITLGVDGLEFDVRATIDGQIAVIHDPTVARTTDGIGAVAEMRLADLRQLDAGARFTADGGRTHPWAGRGLRVPLLDEILSDYDGPMLIEIKTPDASAGTRSVIEHHSAEDRCVVASFIDRALDPFRGSRIAVGSSRRDVARLLVPALLHVPLPRPRFRVMCVPRRFHGLPLPLASYARALRKYGALVHVWTVDDRTEARQLWEVGVHGIISNDPAVILSATDRG